VLLNTQDTNYRPVDDQWPVFAFAMDMGNFTGPTQPWVISVGHVREPAVQYIVAGNGRQDRSLYFWSAFATVAGAVRLVSLVTHLAAFPHLHDDRSLPF
jgi:Domain of unknown function (DUF5127)